MRVLITGAAGYIGSKLTSFLTKNARAHVTAYDNFMWDQGTLAHGAFRSSHCTVKRQDVTEWSDELIKDIKKSDVIIPLAAYVGAPLCDCYPNSAEKLNAEWFSELVTHLDNQQVLYPNTNSGYGSTGDTICTEDTPMNPISLYGKTKNRAEEILKTQYHNATIFRLATVFGWSYRPRMDLLINNLVWEAYNKGHIEVFDGHYRRNYIHINDIVRTFFYATLYDHSLQKMFTPEERVFNLGNDDLNMTKLELVQNICSLTGATYEEVSNQTDPDKRDYNVSSSKLREHLYTPQFDLEYGVEEMLKFYSCLNPDDITKCRNY